MEAPRMAIVLNRDDGEVWKQEGTRLARNVKYEAVIDFRTGRVQEATINLSPDVARPIKAGALLILHLKNAEDWQFEFFVEAVGDYGTLQVKPPHYAFEPGKP
jgi:hypothetical protein